MLALTKKCHTGKCERAWERSFAWGQQKQKNKKIRAENALFCKEKIMENEICESCNCEMRVVGSGYEISGDNSADTPTMLFSVVHLQCVNENCSDFGKKITVRNIIDL